MKKIFTLALAAAALLTACQKNEVAESQDNMATVSFNVQLPAVTKAVADGKTATKLLYEVYHVNSEVSPGPAAYTLIERNYTDINLTANVEFTLMRGATYKFVFWAQSATAPYITDLANFELSNISMAYANPVTGNDENRDAFFGTDEFMVSDTDADNTNRPVTLRRPFAQLNLAAADYGKELLVAEQPVGTLKLKSTSISVTNLAASFNAVIGTAGDTPTTVVFNNTPGGVDLDGTPGIDEFETDVDWISMNYILVADGKTKVNVDATFNVDITYDYTGTEVTNKPVSVYSGEVDAVANYRTNIKGDLFTEGGNLQVQIDPATLGDKDYTVE